MNADDPLDRSTNPELTGLFDALAHPPADPALRAGQIQRAALAARSADPTGAATRPSAIRWGWRRAASWQVAAAAAAVIAVVAGLGADDRLPDPAQRVVSSVADAVGLEVPDGSTPATEGEGLEEPEGTSGQSGTTPATPADPGGPGEPATPATPAEPGRSDNRNDDRDGPDGDNPAADPAAPADPGEPGEPATPAVPSEGNGNPDPGDDGKSQRRAAPPAGSSADPQGKATGRD